ncbi:MAG TPA: efflux transporter outer membrane subunit [Candidatus Acidoferrales bacterium]|jgi:NodT family efflux transporter outer membrane factor (OMF) lipoprotein|nr:efflux transporter outer membrane subunit [Candidatus Acidoferrales bacterium]
MNLMTAQLECKDRKSSNWKVLFSRTILVPLLLLAGCTVGPKYQTPTVQTPAAYKENKDWKVATPQDAAVKEKWWEIYNDPQLNSLEEKVNVSNQSIAAAAASFLEARTLVKQARAQYFPTVSASPSVLNERQNVFRQQSTATATSNPSFTTYSVPFDAAWEPDLWGRVRNTVRANAAGAQASAADLENTRLSMQAELAGDYFQLQGQDALIKLLDETVAAYQESLRLNRVLFSTGIGSDENVAQAETQLESTQALDTNLGILRAQFEHAIALLVGQPASSFSIPAAPLNIPPPDIPLGVPAQLLERRPDIAAAERSVAQANAQIGVATAAFYPNITLSASAGLESTVASSLFTWPSRVWSVGPTLAETIFDAGLRRATVQQFQAAYDVTVANYRNTVLTAFQQVEDNIAELRILSVELGQQDTAVKSADRNLQLATDRYRLGIDPYLNVITAQTTLLSNQQTAVNLRILQMTSSVNLVKALGGGWSVTQIPGQGQLVSNTQPSPQPASNLKN